MSQLRDAYGEFRRQDVEVSTVSVDSPYSHRVWAQELGIGFPMLSDFEHEFMQSYSAAAEPPVPFLAGIARYHTFVVDPSRVLTFVHYQEKGGKPAAADDILDAVRKLTGP